MGILIVDDVEEMRTTCRSLLQTVGYPDVWTARSAAEAYRFLAVGETSRRPPGVDAILMDIEMPGINGIEACRRIKADERLRDIPIIMVTGLSDDVDLEAAFAAGAVDYVTKPVKIVELLARLRSALTLKHELDQRRQRQLELLEITQRLQQANEELERLSTQDSLTGLSNRRAITKALHREWARAKRDGAPLSCVMMDVDHFKDYNDHYGHPQGDVCLQKVAQALRGQVKRPTDMVARYGGEEFMALLPRTNRSGAAAVAEGFHAAVAALRLPHDAPAVHGFVTISLGVATIRPEREGSPQELIVAADRALYDAKHQGRDRVVLQSDEAPSLA